jgi:serine/threonine protein kinase
MNHHLYGLPTPGDMVGDYHIVGLLGEGGHGHVYRAEAFGRSFAVKFMDPGLESFGRREVQALMQLQHPGVDTILPMRGLSIAGTAGKPQDLPPPPWIRKFARLDVQRLELWVGQPPSRRARRSK